MVKKLFAHISALILTATLSVGLAPQALAKFAAPGGGCWCTTYVANHYHLPATYPNAYQWSTWLKGLGWVKDRIPHAGDIEVLRPGAHGADKHFGHVGVIQSASRLNNKQWTITLQGANQMISHQFRADNCGNVSDWTATFGLGSKSGVSYFYKPGVSR